MTTSVSALSLSDLEGHPISPGVLEYFRKRLQDRIYELVLAEFESAEKEGLTRAELARRLGRKPEQMTRWFGTPGNWTMETLSDLLLAIAGAEPDITAKPISVRASRNCNGPEWMSDDVSVRPISGDTTKVTIQNVIRPSQGFRTGSAGSLGAEGYKNACVS